MRSLRATRSLFSLVLVVRGYASLAAVGSVSAIEGEATRTPAASGSVALQMGSSVEIGDTLEVKAGNLKVDLNDQSVIMLSAASKLRIDEANFHDLDRRRFSARLFLGSLWARVTKALVGSEAKFEVSTDRAVAGVRGTVFQVDIVAEPGKEGETLVRVVEGRLTISAKEGGAAKSPQEISAGEALRINKEGMRREVPRQGTGAFERFIHTHQGLEDRSEPQKHERPMERHQREREHRR